MFRNKIFGIAAAATLGSAAMLGSTAANAQINLDAMATAKANPSVTYARETLKDKVDTDSMYYVVNGKALNVTTTLGAAGVGRDDDNLIITFQLEGMVFNTALMGGSLTGSGLSNVALASGGMKNDDMAIYTATKGNANADTMVTLAISDLGIMSDGSGSVSAAIVNLEQRDLLTGIVTDAGTKTASYSGAVAIASGVKPNASPMNLEAKVSSSFQNFGMDTATPPAPVLKGTLGSFMVELADPAPMNAADGNAVGSLGVLVATVGMGDEAPGNNDSSVTIMGDFSFVEKAWLDDSNECSKDDRDLLIRDPNDATMVTDNTKLQVRSLAYVNANSNLCIMVPAHTDEMPVSIPATGPYMAMVMYKAGTAMGMMLPADASHDLGKIMRDGTTVRLPYLSTNDKFNQRLRMVNRSSNDARYELEFHGAGDEPGMDATGTLDPNSITVLSLRTHDVVTAGNGNNTSGTLIIEAQKGMVDVATVQVNRETGGTDTVLYMAE